MVDTTELLETSIGTFGRWQFMFITLIFLSRFSVAYHQLMMVVQHPLPEMNCVNSTIKNPCKNDCPGYIYSQTYLKETVVTYWNLVCGKKWISSFIQSMVMLGILLGNVSLGWVADRFGRKNILIVEIFAQVITGTAAAFMSNLYAFIVLRFFSAYATGGMMLTTFVLLMEFVAKEHRTSIGIAFHFPFQLGHATLGVIAYLVPRWDHIQLVCSLMNILLFCYICLLPESVRWLITRDRNDEAVRILEKAAKCNGLPTDVIAGNVASFVKEHQHIEEVHTGRFYDLIHTRRMRIKIIVLSINWFVVANLFYGVAELMGKIGGNIFINVTVAGLVQLPGTLMCMVICTFLGNKYSLISAYIITFIPMFVMMVLPTNPHWPVIICGSISMMGCSMNFAIIYLYTVELLPTIVRNIGMGITSMCARIGSMAAPYIMLSKFVSSWIPNIVFGTLPIVAGILTFFFLPETKNIEMPDTVEDADKI